MKQVLIQLDDQIAAALERVAPGRSRQRSEFIREAIRRALWALEEQHTEAAYRRMPDVPPDLSDTFDPRVWDAKPARATAGKAIRKPARARRRT